MVRKKKVEPIFPGTAVRRSPAEGSRHAVRMYELHQKYLQKVMLQKSSKQNATAVNMTDLFLITIVKRSTLFLIWNRSQHSWNRSAPRHTCEVLLETCRPTTGRTKRAQ